MIKKILVVINVRNHHLSHPFNNISLFETICLTFASISSIIYWHLLTTHCSKSIKEAVGFGRFYGLNVPSK